MEITPETPETSKKLNTYQIITRNLEAAKERRRYWRSRYMKAPMLSACETEAWDKFSKAHADVMAIEKTLADYMHGRDNSEEANVVL